MPGCIPTIFRKPRDALYYTLPNLAARFSGSLREMRCTNTKALIEAIHSYPVDFISHPT